MLLSGLQYFGQSTSGIGALGFNLKSFVIQLITFILAYLVLKKWAFQPIIKILKERREVIEKGVSLTETLEKEKAELDERVEKELAEARSKADGILSDASDAAKDAIRQAELDAELRAQGILDQAKEQTKQEMVRAKKKLEGEIVNLVSDATEVISGEKLDKIKDAKLIDRALQGGVSR